MFCTYGNENNDAIIEKDKLIDTFFWKEIDTHLSTR